MPLAAAKVIGELAGLSRFRSRSSRCRQFRLGVQFTGGLGTLNHSRSGITTSTCPGRVAPSIVEVSATSNSSCPNNSTNRARASAAISPPAAYWGTSANAPTIVRGRAMWRSSSHRHMTASYRPENVQSVSTIPAAIRTLQNRRCVFFSRRCPFRELFPVACRQKASSLGTRQ